MGSHSPTSQESTGESLSQLVFGTDHDGPDEVLLQTLISSPSASDSLNAIYAHCEGWPVQADPAAKVEYLLNHRIPYGARHIACRGRTVQDLNDVVQARSRMESYLDDSQQALRVGPGEAPDDDAARQRWDDLRGHVEPLPAISPPPLDWQMPVAVVGGIAIMSGGLIQLFRRSTSSGLLGMATLGGIVAGFRILLRGHEVADEKAWVEAIPPTLEHLRELRVWEDHKVQNQMTHVVPVKPGLFRKLTLRGVLAGVDFLARYFWNRGDLGGIPTIHFARWMLIDGGRRLLFFSNFDGSWENYLGDFIDRAYNGLNGVWSNTIEYPPTRFLINDGAQHAEAFKNWTRKYQIETQVWYSAYPDVSVVNQIDSLALCQQSHSLTATELLKTL